jgi:hypothetical protein
MGSTVAGTREKQQDCRERGVGTLDESDVPTKEVIEPGRYEPHHEKRLRQEGRPPGGWDVAYEPKLQYGQHDCKDPH